MFIQNNFVVKQEVCKTFIQVPKKSLQKKSKVTEICVYSNAMDMSSFKPVGMEGEGVWMSEKG